MKKIFGISTIITTALTFGVLVAPTNSTYAATTAQTQLKQGIIGGEHSVSVTPTSNFENVKLNGETQIAHASPGTLTITDATGTGDGYRVNVQATQFHTKGTKTLPKGSLTLSSNGSNITKVGGTNSQNPEFKANNFIIDVDSQTTIVSAKKDQGMGKYNVKFDDKAFALTINPHTTYVEGNGSTTTYESNLTYSIVTGP